MSTITGTDGGTAAEPNVETLELQTGGNGEVERLEMDVAFELLKNWRRRTVLRYLAEEESVTLSDLAEHVAALENDVPEAQLSSKQRKRVYVALYQCHLPMMDRAGVIEFNRARGLVERSPLAEELQGYLESRHDATPWWGYYLGLAGVGALSYAVASVAFTPGTWLTSAVVATLLGAVTLVAAAQRRQNPSQISLREAVETAVGTVVERSSGEESAVDGTGASGD